MSCGAAQPQLVAYWLDELDEAALAALEEHLFACPACTAACAEIADLVDALRARLPPTLTARAIERLQQRGVRMRHTPIAPGAHVTVPFGRDVDVLVHHLQARPLPIDLPVDCEVLNTADGAHLMTVPGVIYDPASGEVNLVCLRHYVEMFPPDGTLRLVAVEPTGRRTIAEYGVMHVLPDR